MPKVYSIPTLEQNERANPGGIQRVIANVSPLLPEYGWEVVGTQGQADISAQHATDRIEAEVLHCHGLYPTGEPTFDHNRQQIEINRRIVQQARKSSVITVPSQWVADIFRRDMHIDPIITEWGVDIKRWEHDGSHQGYVLWNKNRTEGVCTPHWINRLASDESRINFLSTFGREDLGNMRLTGLVAHDKMVEMVKGAAVYLATTKETGDIGSREALAAGVPVLGFRWGALPDFLVHGYNGFLAEPGDYDALRAGLHWCLRNRDKISLNARESAKNFSWHGAAQAFARAYDIALSKKNAAIKVSVIIPCYNYGAYVAEAIQSVLDQDSRYPCEVIVVDDGSTDNSIEVIERFTDVKLIRQENAGVAHARNNGISASTGNLIACLDADDVMGPGFIDQCAAAFEAENTLGLAYTGLTIMGSGKIHSWPVGWDYQKQVERENRVPSLCMFKREAWIRAGGFRQYMHPAEDADLWTRIAAIGYGVKQVTPAPLHVYRVHGEGAIAKRVKENKGDPFRNPFVGYRHDGMAGGGLTWPVRNYDESLVTVFVIQNDSDKLQQTLDSIEGQKVLKWELAVIGGSQPKNALIQRHHYTLAEAISHTRSPLAVVVSAGDHLHPDFLKKAVAAYREHGRYIYTDWYGHDGAERRADDYAQERRIVHPSTILLPTEELRTIESGGELNLAQTLANDGYCGHHLKEALIITDHIVTKEPAMCKCNDKTPVIEAANTEMMMVLYTSPMTGNHPVRGSVTGKTYGRRRGGERFYIFVEDFDPERFRKLDDIELPPSRTTIPADL